MQIAATAADNVGVITASIIFGAFILKAVDLVKYTIQGFQRRRLEQRLTLVLTWAVGFVAVWIFIKTEWGDEVKLGDQTLDQLNTSAEFVFSLAAPSIAALLYDAKKAVDNTDTASSPRLTPAAENERKARVAAALGVPAPPD